MPQAKGIEYTIIRSNRKTMAIEITKNAEVIVRCPYLVNPQRIHTFVSSKSEWINAHLAKKQAQPKLPTFTKEEMEALADKALTVIPPKVKYFAGIMGVKYGNITIRNQKTRWGSCSSKTNLNFNCLLMLTPEKVIDYVIIHELCHLKELNHSKSFWAEVEKVMPDYKIYEKWLKENGSAIIARMK